MVLRAFSPTLGMRIDETVVVDALHLEEAELPRLEEWLNVSVRTRFVHGGNGRAIVVHRAGYLEIT